MITVGRTLRVYFGDPIFLQTDIVLVYFWVPDGLLLFRGRAAFNNKVALTDDGASSLKSTPTNQRFFGTPQTTHVSALPK